jgi:hypothetical protein
MMDQSHPSRNRSPIDPQSWRKKIGCRSVGIYVDGDAINSGGGGRVFIWELRFLREGWINPPLRWGFIPIFGWKQLRARLNALIKI